MSTYNGEKYIREQIDSILKQNGLVVRVFIRDDGSKDSTREIIEDYCCKYDNVTWIDKFSNENLGVRDSFLRLLRYVYGKCIDIHYFSFADQDDYWLKDKLLSGVKKLKSSSNRKGALYYSNKIFVDKNLTEIKKECINLYNDYLEVLWPSLASGCTMIFNRELAEYALLHSPQNRCIHDSWIYRLAKCIGSDIIFDEEAQILYRQHEMNVCGMETTNIHHGVHYMLSNSISLIFKTREHLIQEFVRELYTSSKQYMTEDAKKNSEIVLSYNHKFISKIKLLFFKGVFKRGIKTQMVWIYKVIFNMI